MLEVADIFRSHGPAWRATAHLSLGQLKVMSAIERCRTAALGGHVLRCSRCASSEVSFNSCRDRHCPKCQASAAHRCLEARQADLLPVEYFHVVFTLPAPISAIAWYNKRITGRGHHRNPARLHLPSLRGTDDRHRHPRAQRADPRTAAVPGSDMSTTVPRYQNRPSALRRRGPRADVCAWHSAKRLPRPLHHRDRTTVSLHYRVSARPASRPATPHPTLLGILTYQSP
ncbi:hypothetical protein HDG41_004674 [Paraburkholderia sp. JPY162]|uniref:Transposase zinc-binding domain-containing protein n=1 Tax=Paraburkholderia youngii TaxID=2782701 RepID=A0A7W8L9N9_9BURK|nr:hypothetical protein [Paraburkholderia youngii]